jgi:septal ring factor EnvC (AmiA/AmiB activator)
MGELTVNTKRDGKSMVQRIVKPLALTLVAAISLPLAASASAQQDTGDRISARGAAISERGKAWSDGQRDVQKGQRLIAKSNSRANDADKKLKRARDSAAKAERQLQDAQSDRTQGERMVSDGTAKMQQAEVAYTGIRNGPSAVTPQ